MLDPKRLLEDALRQPYDAGSLNVLRENAEAILHYLEETSEEEKFDLSLEEIDEQRIGQIYETLVLSAELPPEEQATMKALFEASEREEYRIGEAFEALLNDLPKMFRDLERWFESVPAVDPDIQDYLLDSPVAEAIAPELARQLAGKGMTPLTFVYAIEAVSALIETAIYSGELKEEYERLVIGKGSEILIPEPLTIDEVLEAIAVQAKCNLETSQLLLYWFIEVARYKPFLFSWFAADTLAKGVSLRLLEENEDDLQQRWLVDSAWFREAKELPRKVPHTEEREAHRTFKMIHDRFLDKYPEVVTPRDMLNVADMYGYTSLHVSYLPEGSLFIPLSEHRDEHLHALAARQYLDFVPYQDRIQKKEEFCNGAVVEVEGSLPAEDMDVLEDIFTNAEKDRPRFPGGPESHIRMMTHTVLDTISDRPKGHFKTQDLWEKQRQKVLEELFEAV